VRVLAETAGGVQLAAAVSLELAGSFLAPAELESVHGQVARTLSDQVARAGVGKRIRTGPLVAALLGDQRIVDATLQLSERGGTPGDAGVDFQPPASAAVRLDVADVSFAADTFEQAPAGGRQVIVQVRAEIGATPQPGAALDQVQAQLQSRLTTYVGGLAGGTQIDVTSLLSALRDDANYQIDPLRLVVTLSSDDQFVQVAQGGQTFTVQAGQTFSVAAVEVTA
jgi:hypothetical protein